MSQPKNQQFIKNQQFSKNQQFMKAALEQAEIAYKQGDVPVGAVLVKDSQIIARARNLVQRHDNPIAHAEMLVISEACKILNTKFLLDCDLYVTLEPCAMCAGALAHARIRRLYYGAEDIKSGGTDNGARVPHQTSCHHKYEIYSGILETAAQELLTGFFKEKRGSDV